MKKLLIALMFSTIALPLAAGASSTSFSPAAPSVSTGQTFSVSVVITPQETDYTAKIALSYPANLLEVVSFSQASGWLPLSQPGYDSIDNASGAMVKTAGYSGGFSSQKVFGTVTFRALAAGTAVISASGGTQILDADNQNTFTGGGRATVSIAAPVALPVLPVTKVPPTSDPSNPARTPLTPSKKAPVNRATSSAVQAEATSTPVATSSAPVQNVAAVAGSRTQSAQLAMALLALVLSFGFGVFIGRRQRA